MANISGRPLNTCLSIMSFIIAPFLSFIGFIVRAKNERNLWILFFFYLLFGLCFTINQESGFDSLRYVEFFKSMEYGSFSDIYIANMINESSIGDIYFPTVAWLASKIGGSNYHIMFLCFALIFAIFTINSLKVFYANSHTSLSWMYSLVVFILISNNFIFNINGMRFWTAAWILLYGILTFYVVGRRIGLLWIIITPLVHSTFIIPIFLIIVAKILGRYEKIWIVFLIISVPFSFLSVNLIPLISNYIPDIYLGKFDFYTDSKYILERSSGVGFTYLENFMRFCLMILEVYILYKYFKSERRNQNWKLRPLFHLTVIFVAFANFFSAIPSVGRYITVALPLVVFFIWIKAESKIYHRYMLLCLGTMSFSIMDLIVNKILLVLPSDFYFLNAISLISDYI